ncbi:MULTISPECIES: peptidoglycan-binding protein [unclassified Picosynechococcus]|uniref:peptidoglycan-binding domain-containing protein n=1 Tax=unclassified Picosynechococcus TaxID=3079910 RepID=UPI00069381AF|nr:MULTISPECIES: peptidoglycan-binding domain-containing protein [unclassified Picosynechococcus]ANV88578.1 hypothetical protein AWQ22_14565 [Picosynechococcus sp. PCC 7117]
MEKIFKKLGWAASILLIPSAVAFSPAAQAELCHHRDIRYDCGDEHVDGRLSKYNFISAPFLRSKDYPTIVKDLQVLLHELGYYEGKITGEYDSATMLAVRAFQDAYQLEVTGEVNDITWMALKSHEEDVVFEAGDRLDIATGTYINVQSSSAAAVESTTASSSASVRQTEVVEQRTTVRQTVTQTSGSATQISETTQAKPVRGLW